MLVVSLRPPRNMRELPSHCEFITLNSKAVPVQDLKGRRFTKTAGDFFQPEGDRDAYIILKTGLSPDQSN